MSDYRSQVVEHDGVACLHVMIDTPTSSETYAETYISLEDIARSAYNQGYGIYAMPDAVLQKICESQGYTKPGQPATMTEQELIEALADKEHASWARWMEYLFSKCTRTMHGDMVIPMELALRWKIQTNTPYARLSESEKQSDREEVEHILPIIRKWTQVESEVKS